MTTIPLCRDCKFRRNLITPLKCVAPGRRIDVTVAAGERPTYTILERDGGNCGPKGSLFEPSWWRRLIGERA